MIFTRKSERALSLKLFWLLEVGGGCALSRGWARLQLILVPTRTSAAGNLSLLSRLAGQRISRERQDSLGLLI